MSFARQRESVHGDDGAPFGGHRYAPHRPRRCPSTSMRPPLRLDQASADRVPNQEGRLLDAEAVMKRSFVELDGFLRNAKALSDFLPLQSLADKEQNLHFPFRQHGRNASA